jgi:protein gp37
MATRLHGRFGYPDKNPFRVTLHPDKLLQPLSTRKPRRIFISSMSDWMHPDVPDDYRDKMLAVMALTPWHTYYTLTKRADNLLRYAADPGMRSRVNDQICNWLFRVVSADAMNAASAWEDTHYPETAGEGFAREWPRPNIILGVTAENQEMLDLRVPLLLRLGALGWRTMVSAEPLLGPLDLHVASNFSSGGHGPSWLLPIPSGAGGMTATIGFVIVGGETGPGARPMHPDWVRKVRDDCAAAGVPFFLKQLGEWVPSDEVPASQADTYSSKRRGSRQSCKVIDETLFVRVGTKAAGRVLDGRTHDARPNPKGAMNHDAR